MTKPQDYFISLLQAYNSVGSQGKRDLEGRITEHLDRMQATVDYDYVEPEERAPESYKEAPPEEATTEGE